MKYISDVKTCRSMVFKFVSIFFLSFNICLLLDSGNSASPSDQAVYSIHLFSYTGIEEAKAKVKEFTELGYNAFYRQEAENGKTGTYNVYIERYKTQTEAEKEANVLKELDLISDYDIREITEKAKSVPKKEAGSIKKTNSLKSYYLKVDALREKSNAEDTVKKLQDAGYHAFYNYETVKGSGEWYRVYIDEYKTKADAQKDAGKLLESGLIAGYEIKRTTEKIREAETTRKDQKMVYSLHVASYKDMSHADEDVLRLKGLGFKAFSLKAEISGEQWFRVYVGEFSEEKDARKTGAELVEKGVITYFKPFLVDKIIE